MCVCGVADTALVSVDSSDGKGTGLEYGKGRKKKKKSLLQIEALKAHVDGQPYNPQHRGH